MRSFRSEQFSSKDPNLHVFFYKIKGEDPIHTHDFIEIMYVNSGEIEQFVNDKHFVTKKGDLVFMNYNSVHKFKTVRGGGSHLLQRLLLPRDPREDHQPR